MPTDYAADDPETARRRQQAVQSGARRQAACAEDSDAARPVVTEPLGALGEEAHVRPPLHAGYGSIMTIGGNAARPLRSL
ncbi:hypothetical protein H0H10_20985 [Streptomyces sp. TRM S81-3]|uniref:Uncharacterized protein n=1 Tax=Streptomyces griseicoloratus TaxID=2752516 RepID=A0A926L447_9ACTN|nr:hypothetical protein [Streptomyces griseicoloratus]MBD0421595.1 hypothetical protein [Streptomyces griseicoloratus]